MRCEAPEGVKTAVRKGMGMGLLYGDNVMPDIRRGEFAELALPGIELEGRSYLVYHKTRPLSQDAEDLLALLRRHRSRKYLNEPAARRVATVEPHVIRNSTDDPE
ncbi:MAG: hypothetical protein HY695_21440 [Deltaproteobacteria bacterium]|nr:hypothetical protein [Deltaproteobacteria bacterium]